jgi:hypothetical protein
VLVAGAAVVVSVGLLVCGLLLLWVVFSQAAVNKPVANVVMNKAIARPGLIREAVADLSICLLNSSTVRKGN